MSVEKIRAEAERAWGEGKRTYLVRLTQMPGGAVANDDDDNGKPERVLSTRIGDVENAIEAICEAGWELHSLQLGDTKVAMFNSHLTVIHANVTFVRPSS